MYYYSVQDSLHYLQRDEPTEKCIRCLRLEIILDEKKPEQSATSNQPLIGNIEKPNTIGGITRPARVYGVVSQLCYVFVASRCAFQDVMTPGIGRIHPRPHLHLQLRRANLTERGLLANPNTCISTLACTNLKPRSSHSDLHSTQERDIFRNTSFSATEANIQRHLCRRLRVMINRIAGYIPFGLVYCGQPSLVGVQRP